MYTPSHFKETRREKLQALVTENPFATLISVHENKPILTHLPFLLDPSGSFLISHMARANPHWRLFESGGKVTVVFQGPHAYVSPAWYPPTPTRVPTWNYTAVHLSGQATLIVETRAAWNAMTELVQSNERKYGPGWEPERSDLDSKLQALVVFRVEIESWEGKFKLSQQQTAEAREQAAHALLAGSTDTIQATGRWMLEENLPSESLRRGSLLLSADKHLLQPDTVYRFLRSTYWAANRNRETMLRSLEHSLCYGVYDGKRQVAFCRIVTDYSTFAYLCDVFVDEEYRGRGISKWMVETLVAHPRLQNLRRFLLATQDAHGLYAQYGFHPIDEAERNRLMGIRY